MHRKPVSMVFRSMRDVSIAPDVAVRAENVVEEFCQNRRGLPNSAEVLATLVKSHDNTRIVCEPRRVGQRDARPEE